MKRMSTSAVKIQPGTQVIISDGTPMPPVRFKRKLEDWQQRNYAAVVLGESERGGYRLQFSVGLTLRVGAVVFLRDVGQNVEVWPVIGAPPAPLTTPDGIGEVHIDHKAWLAQHPGVLAAARAAEAAAAPTAILY